MRILLEEQRLDPFSFRSASRPRAWVQTRARARVLIPSLSGLLLGHGPVREPRLRAGVLIPSLSGLLLGLPEHKALQNLRQS